MEVGNITKAAAFKSFLHRSYKNTQIFILCGSTFYFFIRHTLTDDFGGLHKNMNCAFPLIKLIRDKIHHKIKIKVKNISPNL